MLIYIVPRETVLYEHIAYFLIPNIFHYVYGLFMLVLQNKYCFDYNGATIVWSRNLSTEYRSYINFIPYYIIYIDDLEFLFILFKHITTVMNNVSLLLVTKTPMAVSVIYLIEVCSLYNCYFVCLQRICHI